MRRLSLILVAFVWLWAPPASGEAARAYEQGLLWRIEGPNAAPSYVFGTIHVSDSRVQTLVRNMLETVGQVDSVSLELVPSPELSAAAAQYMFDPHGPPLSQRIGQQLFAETAAAAAPYGLNANTLERFKPWAVAVTLSLPASELRAQAEGFLNSERMLEWFATNNKIAARHRDYRRTARPVRSAVPGRTGRHAAPHRSAKRHHRRHIRAASQRLSGGGPERCLSPDGGVLGRTADPPARILRGRADRGPQPPNGGTDRAALKRRQRADRGRRAAFARRGRRAAAARTARLHG